MPFQSEAQRRLMWAKHPEIAKRWADETGPQKNLPMHVRQSKGGGNKAIEAVKAKGGAK